MKVIGLKVGMIATNCYIVYDEKTKEGAVVDPGDQAPAILQAAAAEGVALRYVLLTHGHFDHILAVNAIVKETGAKLVAPKGDLWLLRRENMGSFKAFANGFTETPVDIEAEEGTSITVGGLELRYLSTPGHTPGSSVIQVEDTLFTGDTLFRGECGRCDLEGGDFNQMLSSLKRLAELAGDYKVLPGHEGASTLAEERVSNPYMLQAVR